MGLLPVKSITYAPKSCWLGTGELTRMSDEQFPAVHTVKSVVFPGPAGVGRPSGSDFDSSVNHIKKIVKR